MPKTPEGWALCRVLALLGSFASVATLAEACAVSHTIPSGSSYFVGEGQSTWGTPASVHEIDTLRPASLPAERMTADILALSVFADLLAGFTVKDESRSTLPVLRPTMALTSSAGALDLRPRLTNSASFSGISSNLKSDIIPPLRELAICLTYA